MARQDDDFEDDTPRKRRRRDDDDEFENRSRNARRRDEDDDEMDERPRKNSRRRDDFETSSRTKNGNIGLPMTLGAVAIVILLTCGACSLRLFNVFNRAKAKNQALIGPMKFEQEVESIEAIQARKDLLQVGLAMINFRDRYDGFPTNSYDAVGKPLLSWRVHILPFIGQEPLYRQFKLDEPWDSPHNKPLLNNIPQLYLSPSESIGQRPKGTTTYLRSFSSAGALMDPRYRKMGQRGAEIGPTLTDILDGISRTIIVVESSEAVEWTKPEDLSWSGGASLPPLGGDQNNPGKFWVLFADGSVRAVNKKIAPQDFKAAITIAGGEFFQLP